MFNLESVFLLATVRKWNKNFIGAVRISTQESFQQLSIRPLYGECIKTIFEILKKT